MIVCHVGQWERWNAFSLLCLKDKKTTLFSFMGKTRQDKKMELIFGMFEFIHYDLCSWKHCTLYSLNSHIENQELQHSRPPLVAAWQGGRNDSEDSTPSDCKNFQPFYSLLGAWNQQMDWRFFCLMWESYRSKEELQSCSFSIYQLDHTQLWGTILYNFPRVVPN